jgi:uncharacterized membrane protein
MKYREVVKWLKDNLFKLSERPEYIYLWVAVVALLGFVFITPPFQGPDEEAHYARTQYIAHGYLVPSPSAKIPDSINEVTNITFYKQDIRGRTAERYSLSNTKAALMIPLNNGKTYRPAMVAYNPLLYLPAIPGVLLANALNLSPLISMYVARLSLGIASIGLIFFAIRLIPHKKYLLLGVGLIPTMLFQQAMITADSISYALLALFIAYILYLRQKKVILRKQWIILGLLCLSVALAKPLVFLFLPLVLMLIKQRYAMRWIGTIALICVVAFIGWNYISNRDVESLPTASNTPASVNSNDQLKLITTHPTRLLRVTWNSYMTPYGDDEVRGVIGIFGAADTAYPLWMYSGYIIVLGILAFITFDRRKIVPIAKRWKIIAVLLCVLYFMAVNVALYLAYTPVNFDIFYGIQGRYFLPIAIILATVVFTGGIKLSQTDNRKIKVWIVVALSVLVALALFVTFQRYYLYTP